jgi:hypothetical protein
MNASGGDQLLKQARSALLDALEALRGVRLSKRCLISGCFGHAARLRRSMVSSS